MKQQTPLQSLNKAFRKVKPSRTEIELFKENLIALLDQTNDTESEEFHKNLMSDFLKKTYFEGKHYINTKGRQDLVIHNGDKSQSSVGVLIEAKKPTNKAEMPSKDRLNSKALQELILYYLRERVSLKNLELKYLIATNIHEWFIFDANVFENCFAQDKALVKQFEDFEQGRLGGNKTDFFYKEIAAQAIEKHLGELNYTYFDARNYEKTLRNEDKKDDKKLIALFKLLSPEHLLKLPFVNDSNTLDKRFYGELLHIIGLTEKKEKGKKLIERKDKGERDRGSILENAIIQLDTLDKISRLDKPSQFGETSEERLFNVGLELTITWLNRILFLKLLEAQLLTYHKGDKTYEFLSFKKIHNYDDLNSLFFRVLAKRYEDRAEEVNKLFGYVPYLNSSLFEPSEIEHITLFISQLEDDKTLPIYSSTVLKDSQGKRLKGEMNAIEYLFTFLDAYDFSSEGSEEIQEENKTLISASVLGLIFEKINGYKDGSFFTPSFITMYMCRESITRALQQKFKEVKGWDCNDLNELYDKIEDRAEANEIVNSIKVCDPAVGSGHFLVSALNEIIAIKSELRILQDREGKRLKEYQIEVVNDELIITDEDGEFYEYNPKNKESQRVQEAIFNEKQLIIENSLFGVDINPNSVKICRLRLWIELLKNAYYKNENELETLPNIDINIKCGNSLVSRFGLDSDISKALKSTKWNIDSYKTAVDSYRNAQSKEEKREMLRLIRDIKGDFKSEINRNDPKLKDLSEAKGELSNLTEQSSLFEMSKTEKAVWNKEVEKVSKKIQKLESEIEEIKNNKVYEDAFEWRFEFPEVLNEEGEFVGFDVIIGNPPYVQLSKSANISSEYKSYLLETYKTSGGRLNTFIFFIHLSNRILNDNGVLHYIIPNTILSQEYYRFSRNFLINEVSLTEIVNFSKLPFEDAVVETVLIQFVNSEEPMDTILIKELSQDEIKHVSELKRDTVNKDSKLSFIYQENPVIEKVYDKQHTKFGSLCHINQGIALKGDKSLSLKNRKESKECYKLLDGRNINKYSINWDGVWLDYDLDRIHSCKRKDIFESKQKLLFRRVSSTLIFTYDEEQFFALNTLVIVNPKDSSNCPNLKFILGLMNTRLMSYVYKNKFKSTKTVFSEIQARSVKELPIPKVTEDIENAIAELSDRVLKLKRDNMESLHLEEQIEQMVYQLYGLTEEEIEIIEQDL